MAHREIETRRSLRIMNHEKYLERCVFLARFAYDGAEFFGVQEQPGLKTVLGALRVRIEACAGKEARSLVVAARTDRGVSALVNYATFYLRAPLDEAAFQKNLADAPCNGLLALVVKKVPPKTNARGNSSAKTYRYTIKDSVPTPKSDAMVWEIAVPLSVSCMERAARDFVGIHDFSSVRGGGCEAGTTVREILAIDVVRTTTGYILIDICGEGFLRKMVRNMVGLLVEVGAGLRAPYAIEPILAERSRAAAGIMAPAHGLCLMDIDFKDVNKSR